MLEQIFIYFTIDIIYLWLNIGVIPFWLVLVFFPSSKICSFFVSSIFPIVIFSSIYLYLIYFFFVSDYDFTSNFALYLSLDNLKDLFSNDGFLIIFWTHFLAINLFCGSWIVKDSQKYNISKYLVFFPILITYFIGPLGLFFYWIIRIFYAKRISLFD
tara:strand:- start:114 stop:587 length:474 start_codon:yes stop_codon:yes gene_type:complete